MHVLPPINMTNSMLISSNVAEDDYDEWDNATTYDVDDYVIVISGDGTYYHNVYQSVESSNTGNKPWEDDVDNPQHWNLIGKTNRWKMFELIRNTQTVNDSSIEIVIQPGKRVSSIGLFSLQAEQIEVVMESGSDEVYRSMQTLTTRSVTTWYEYFFTPLVFQKAALFIDLPPYSDALITVTITRASGDVKCGGIVFGQSVYLGITEEKAESDSLNFSTVERDEFGNTLLVPRRTIPKTYQRVFSDKEKVNEFVSLRDNLNASVAMWYGLEDANDGYFNALLILGFYRKFLISLDYPDYAMLTLEIEEV